MPSKKTTSAPRSKARAGSDFDAVAWAEANPPRGCYTCANEAALSILRPIAEAVKSKRLAELPAPSKLLALLQERAGYTGTVGALKHHLREHEGIRGKA
jgi:hypothetical protein